MLSITPSLYNAYYWYAIKDHGSKEDFLRVLRKERTEPTVAMQMGIDFENHVRDICEGRAAPSDDNASKLADIVRGGIWQPWLGREYKGLWLYGRADVIKCDTIYDIKVCDSYDDFGKYQYSLQHHIYSYCTEIKKFVYAINERKKTVDYLFFEPYHFDYAAMEDMDIKINDLIGFINNNDEFKKEFESKWRRQESN